MYGINYCKSIITFNLKEYWVIMGSKTNKVALMGCEATQIVVGLNIA